jgi:flagellar biosynthesis anti-sigma factor FlgM
MNVNFPDSTASGTKVENPQPNRIAAGRSPQRAPNTGASQEASGAEVSLSPTGVQALRAHLATVPSIRQERVQSLQKAVENGSYNPTSQQIADAIHADLFGAASNSGS